VLLLRELFFAPESSPPTSVLASAEKRTRRLMFWGSRCEKERLTNKLKTLVDPFSFARVPYVVRFERVDKFGAHGTPSETGLFTPNFGI
jgi:hypothetical protein